MKEFILYIIKSGICLSVFLIIYRLFLRRATFFRFNRYYLITGIIISFIIPAIRYTYDVAIKMQPISASGIENIGAPSTYSALNIWTVTTAIYGIGIVILLVRNLLAYRKLFMLAKEGTQTYNTGYKIINTNKVQSPFTVLNYILLNTGKLSNTEKDLILKHEITHIDQKHWVDLILSECLLILQWFNPMAWIYVSLQKENHEFLADKAVIDQGIKPELYQAVLINQRFQGPVFSFSNSFNYKNQLNRLAMIKKVKSSPWKRAAALAIIPVLGVFVWASAEPRYVIEQSDMVQVKDSVKTVTIKVKEDVASTKLVIVDGKEVPEADLSKLNPNDIDNISVLKDESGLKVYGKKGENGVIIINTKGQDKTDNTIETNMMEEPNIKVVQDNSVGIDPQTRPLSIVDGKEQPSEVLQDISPDKIEKIEVLKGKAATDKYGEKGKNGVVIVTLKK